MSRKIDSAGPLLPGALFVLLALLMPTGAAAGTEEEVAHLLGYIETSDCLFVRNREDHPSAEAREHIEKKYEYAARWIKTAEDFIKYAATKSSITGKIYQIRCQGQELPSAEWLQAELVRYRESLTAP